MSVLQKLTVFTSELIFDVLQNIATKDLETTGNQELLLHINTSQSRPNGNLSRNKSSCLEMGIHLQT